MRGLVIFMFSAVSFYGAFAQADSEPPAQQLLVLNDMTTKVVDSTANATMTLTDGSGGTRIRKLTMLTKLETDGHNNMRLIQFTDPDDIKGTVSLLIEKTSGDDDMWIYLPALEKVRRLVADNERDSFVGSDLTFGDLVGLNPDDWTATLVREDTVDGRPVHVVQSVPKTDLVRDHTGYSKRVAWIDDQSYVALRTDYWDESGNFLKTITTGDIIPVAGASGKWQFLNLSAKNVQTGHETDLTLENYKANQNLSVSQFNPNALDPSD